jgi:hypothetical protein
VARPEKKGLDYFPLDTDMDDKLYSIETDFGLIGYAIVIKLFQRTYKEGYYILFNDKQVLIFCRKNNTEKDLFEKVLEACLDEGIFHKEIYEKYKILTSRGVQKRYFEASKRKKTLHILSEVTLIDISTYNNLVVVNINGNVCDMEENIINSSGEIIFDTTKANVTKDYKYKTLEDALNDKDLKGKLLKINHGVNWDVQAKLMRTWIIGKPLKKDWERFVTGWIGRAKPEENSDVPYHQPIDMKRLRGE